jgi:pSer/pThr/pTyr-binding forkhead associated (FHA) protein
MALQAWLEFIDAQTGSPRRVAIERNSFSIGRAAGDLRLPEGDVSELHALISRERENFVIRDLGSKNGTFVNNRQVVEAQLTHLDEIRIGKTRLVFNAVFEQATAVSGPIIHPDSRELTPAPGHHLDAGGHGRTLFPFLMFIHPRRFWPRALETGIFSLRRTWLIHLLSVGILAATAFASGGITAWFTFGFLVGATAVALGLMAITCSVFFAFDSMPDAPHRLTQSIRFVFCVAPFLLAAHCIFLIWAAHGHPGPDRYFLVAAAPTGAIWLIIASQSRHAFSSGWSRGFAFAITASVPWNLLMTGVMHFLV